MKLVYNINGIRSHYLKIKSDLKPNDLLVIDLVSDVWEWAQIDFAEQLSGGDVEAFIRDAMADTRKFGMFNDNKWNYIKALHKFVEDIIVRKPCHFIGVCNERSVDVEVIKGGKKAKDFLADVGFSDMSVRAGGNKLLPYKFETVLRIGFDNNNEKYFFQVVGDRGHNKNLQQKFYGKNMYDKLLEWREMDERIGI